jgi:hypothetical protein
MSDESKRTRLVAKIQRAKMNSHQAAKLLFSVFNTYNKFSQNIHHRNKTKKKLLLHFMKIKIKR